MQDPGAATKAAETLLEKGVLGALLFLSVACILWLLVKYVAMVTERVNDREKAAEREKAAAAEWVRAIEGNTKALGELTASVRASATSQSDMAKAVDRNSTATEGLRGSVDGVVREAIIIGRRPSTGGMQAVTPARDERRPIRRED